MPQKHATIEPLPPAFYARAMTGHQQTFSTGPFPSREDAIDLAPGMLGLDRGQEFEVGKLIPFTPRIDPDTFLLPLCKGAVETCGRDVTEGWVHTLSTLPRADLEAALNLVLQGWLARHQAFPHFGMVDETSSHTFTQ